MYFSNLGVLGVYFFQICVVIQCETLLPLIKTSHHCSLFVGRVIGLLTTPPVCSGWGLLGPSPSSASCTGYVQHSDEVTSTSVLGVIYARSASDIGHSNDWENYRHAKIISFAALTRTITGLIS